jgi:hypothetical protein
MSVQAQTIKNPGRKLPFWSKALIALVVLGLAAVYGLGLVSISGTKELAIQMLDPAAITRAAHDIGDFPVPLPPGYRYIIGLGMPGLDMVTIEHAPERQLISFFGFEREPDFDVKHVLRYGYSQGLIMLKTTAVFTSESEHATATVANHEMPYIIGNTMEFPDKHKGRGMVGAIQIPVKEHRKNILIYSLQTSDVPYNQQITMDLLNSIKSF